MSYQWFRGEEPVGEPRSTWGEIDEWLVKMRKFAGSPWRLVLSFK